jgi:hypothetical protein
MILECVRKIKTSLRISINVFHVTYFNIDYMEGYRLEFRIASNSTELLTYRKEIDYHIYIGYVTNKKMLCDV